MYSVLQVYTAPLVDGLQETAVLGSNIETHRSNTRAAHSHRSDQLEANITIKRCLSNFKAYPIRWRHLKPLLDKTVLRAQLVPLWIATDLHNPWHLADYPQEIFEEEKTIYRQNSDDL